MDTEQETFEKPESKRIPIAQLLAIVVGRRQHLPELLNYLSAADAPIPPIVGQTDDAMEHYMQDRLAPESAQFGDVVQIVQELIINGAEARRNDNEPVIVQVTTTIEESGTEEITITDNGRGMSMPEFIGYIQPHAGLQGKIRGKHGLGATAAQGTPHIGQEDSYIEVITRSETTGEYIHARIFHDSSGRRICEFTYDQEAIIAEGESGTIVRLQNCDIPNPRGAVVALRRRIEDVGYAQIWIEGELINERAYHGRTYESQGTVLRINASQKEINSRMIVRINITGEMMVESGYTQPGYMSDDMPRIIIDLPQTTMQAESRSADQIIIRQETEGILAVIRAVSEDTHYTDEQRAHILAALSRAVTILQERNQNHQMHRDIERHLADGLVPIIERLGLAVMVVAPGIEQLDLGDNTIAVAESLAIFIPREARERALIVAHGFEGNDLYEADIVGGFDGPILVQVGDRMFANREYLAIALSGDHRAHMVATALNQHLHLWNNIGVGRPQVRGTFTAEGFEQTTTGHASLREAETIWPENIRAHKHQVNNKSQVTAEARIAQEQVTGKTNNDRRSWQPITEELGNMLENEISSNMPTAEEAEQELNALRMERFRDTARRRHVLGYQDDENELFDQVYGGEESVQRLLSLSNNDDDEKEAASEVETQQQAWRVFLTLLVERSGNELWVQRLQEQETVPRWFIYLLYEHRAFFVDGFPNHSRYDQEHMERLGITDREQYQHAVAKASAIMTQIRRTDAESAQVIFNANVQAVWRMGTRIATTPQRTIFRLILTNPRLRALLPRLISVNTMNRLSYTYSYESLDRQSINPLRARRNVIEFAERLSSPDHIGSVGYDNYRTDRLWRRAAEILQRDPEKIALVEWLLSEQDVHTRESDLERAVFLLVALEDTIHFTTEECRQTILICQELGLSPATVVQAIIERNGHIDSYAPFRLLISLIIIVREGTSAPARINQLSQILGILTPRIDMSRGSLHQELLFYVCGPHSPGEDGNFVRLALAADLVPYCLLPENLWDQEVTALLEPNSPRLRTTLGYSEGPVADLSTVVRRNELLSRYPDAPEIFIELHRRYFAPDSYHDYYSQEQRHERYVRMLDMIEFISEQRAMGKQVELDLSRRSYYDRVTIREGENITSITLNEYFRMQPTSINSGENWLPQEAVVITQTHYTLLDQLVAFWYRNQTRHTAPMTWEAFVDFLESPPPEAAHIDRTWLNRDVLSAITRQGGGVLRFWPEWQQNAYNAYEALSPIPQERVVLAFAGIDGNRMTGQIIDFVGMTPEEALWNLTVVGFSSQEQTGRSLARFRQGWLTCLQGNEVRIRTSVGDGIVTYLRFLPQRDRSGAITGVDIDFAIVEEETPHGFSEMTWFGEPGIPSWVGVRDLQQTVSDTARFLDTSELRVYTMNTLFAGTPQELEILRTAAVEAEGQECSIYTGRREIRLVSINKPVARLEQLGPWGIRRLGSEEAPVLLQGGFPLHMPEGAWQSIPRVLQRILSANHISTALSVPPPPTVKTNKARTHIENEQRFVTENADLITALSVRALARGMLTGRVSTSRLDRTSPLAYDLTSEFVWRYRQVELSRYRQVIMIADEEQLMRGEIPDLSDLRSTESHPRADQLTIIYALNLPLVDSGIPEIGRLSVMDLFALRAGAAYLLPSRLPNEVSVYQLIGNLVSEEPDGTLRLSQEGLFLLAEQAKLVNTVRNRIAWLGQTFPGIANTLSAIQNRVSVFGRAWKTPLGAASAGLGGISGVAIRILASNPPDITISTPTASTGAITPEMGVITVAIGVISFLALFTGQRLLRRTETHRRNRSSHVITEEEDTEDTDTASSPEVNWSLHGISSQSQPASSSTQAPERTVTSRDLRRIANRSEPLLNALRQADEKRIKEEESIPPDLFLGNRPPQPDEGVFYALADLSAQVINRTFEPAVAATPQQHMGFYVDDPKSTAHASSTAISFNLDYTENTRAVREIIEGDTAALFGPFGERIIHEHGHSEEFDEEAESAITDATHDETFHLSVFRGFGQFMKAMLSPDESEPDRLVVEVITDQLAQDHRPTAINGREFYARLEEHNRQETLQE